MSNRSAENDHNKTTLYSLLFDIKRARNSKWQREWETVVAKYIKPYIEKCAYAHNSYRQDEVVE